MDSREGVDNGDDPPPPIDTSMIRAISARTVLRGFGRVFRSKGIMQAYALSQESDKLGYFISHSWTAPWLSKYVTMLFHFNFWLAAILSAIFIGLFLLTGLLLIDHDVWNEIRMSINPSLIFVAIGVLVFVPSLIYGAELLSLCPSRCYSNRNTRCFLDKCCINQSDPVLKRRGIEALDAFLAKSDVLLILWSPDYFLRLWCAYEVAVYMTLDEYGTRKRRVVMIPLELVSFASLVFGLDLVIQIVSVNFFFQDRNGLPTWATRLVATALAAMFAAFAYFFSYRWQVDQAFLRKQLAEFSLAKVECSDPSDRPLVLRDISHRYSRMKNGSSSDPTMSRSVTRAQTQLKATGGDTIRLPDDVDESHEQLPPPLMTRHVSSFLPDPVEDPGLKAFEEYVHTRLQQPIEKALGSHHCVLPYKFLFAMSLPALWAALGLSCYWILKANGMGDTEDVIDGSAVAFLVCSRFLRAITFYPLLTAALLLYQDSTEKWVNGSSTAQVTRGLVAVMLIGVYFYMFGFHYIFLQEMEADIVFYTTLPQVLLFLLIYTRLGAFTYRWVKRLREKATGKPSQEEVVRVNPAETSTASHSSAASDVERAAS
jgi:hypothetical protein